MKQIADAAMSWISRRKLPISTRHLFPCLALFEKDGFNLPFWQISHLLSQEESLPGILSRFKT